MEAAPRKCIYPGCTAIGLFAGWYCDEHKARSRRESDRARRGNRTYNAAEDRFRAAVLSLNPICQRVIFGERCRNASRIIHHLIDVRERPDLAHDQRNVVMVCAGCHPRPWDEDQGIFVPTIWHEFMSDAELPPMILPGAIVPKATKLWSRDERLKFFQGEA